ncbi:nucleoid-associated protein [Paraburkholderia phytofirmans]|uniref:nucleoid-associated protein n=1 Tax=Paraburkholderia phytofirmans TaxID=261302 RepID=UPI0013140802|nr:nucleoid-associated protein [Paraburkholderia phytofirmans]
MPIQIRHSVIHGFTKEAGEPVANVDKKDRLLDNTLPSVFSLVQGMVTLLGKKESSQVWGRFGNNGREGPFPGRFADYVNDVSSVEGFLALSHLAVDEISRTAEAQQASTGGHILCATYDDDAGNTRVIVAMIKQRSGLQLDDNLVPINIVEIDMSKLHQAAQIRVGEFRQSIELEAELHDDEDEEQADVTYLSFVAKRADRGSSAYFINALGCEVGVSSTKATTRLYKAVDAFFRENDELNPYLRTAKDALSAFLRQEADAQRLVTMDALQDVMDRVVRPEHAHLVREMTQTLNGDRFKVPDGFLVSETVLRKHTKVVLEGARLTLKFDRAMLGTDRNAELFFDEDNRTLTIQNLSDEMIGRLQQTLNDG